MKKFLSLLLVALLCFALVACGGAEEPAANNENVGEAAAEVLKLGGIGPTSGSYSNYGTSVRNGAQIAVDEINAAGGVNGQPLEYKFEDSQGDPEAGVNAYGALMDWGMNLSLGGVFSGETASITAAAVDDDIMLLTPSGSADACISANDKAFRVCFFDSYQGTAAADYIKDHNMADKVGVFYESDYDYSNGLYQAFVAECEKIGIEIVETQTFTTTTNTSFDTQINALAASGVKVVFMPIYAEEASTFMTQARGKFADDVYFFGADGLDGILGKVEQDPSIANNVLMLTPFSADSKDEKVVNFVESYKAKFDAVPDQFAADGYDAVYILKAAYEKAGTTSGEAMAKAMTELKYDGVTGSMTWGADGNTSKAAIAILYHDGVGTIFGE